MQKFGTRAGIALCCIAALLLSCASAGNASGPGEDMEETPFSPLGHLRMPEVGESAPLFEILTLDGKTYSLKDETSGKVVSLVFWSLFCAPCRRSMPILNDLYIELRDKGFEIIAVNMDGERLLEGIRTYVAEEKLAFPILMDEFIDDALKVADPYGVQGTPTTYLIDKDGYIAFAKAGDIPRDELHAMVMRELEKTPDRVGDD